MKKRSAEKTEMLRRISARMLGLGEGPHTRHEEAQINAHREYMDEIEREQNFEATGVRHLLDEVDVPLPLLDP